MQCFLIRFCTKFQKPKQKVTPKLSAIRTVPAKVQATPQSSRRSDVPSTPDTSKVTKAATTEKGPAVKRKLIESPNVPNKKKDNGKFTAAFFSLCRHSFTK